MHPQIQQVFPHKIPIRVLSKRILQGVITTHSNEMVRVAEYPILKVMRKIGTFTSNLYNPALFG